MLCAPVFIFTPGRRQLLLGDIQYTFLHEFMPICFTRKPEKTQKYCRRQQFVSLGRGEGGLVVTNKQQLQTTNTTDIYCDWYNVNNKIIKELKQEIPHEKQQVISENRYTVIISVTEQNLGRVSRSLKKLSQY